VIIEFRLCAATWPIVGPMSGDGPTTPVVAGVGRASGPGWARRSQIGTKRATIASKESILKAHFYPRLGDKRLDASADLRSSPTAQVAPYRGFSPGFPLTPTLGFCSTPTLVPSRRSSIFERTGPSFAAMSTATSQPPRNRNHVREPSRSACSPAGSCCSTPRQVSWRQSEAPSTRRDALACDPVSSSRVSARTRTSTQAVGFPLHRRRFVRTTRTPASRAAATRVPPILTTTPPFLKVAPLGCAVCPTMHRPWPRPTPWLPTPPSSRQHDQDGDRRSADRGTQ
jgi:hypothetical protein